MDSTARRAVGAAAVMARASLRPERPDRLLRALMAMAWTGPTTAGALARAPSSACSPRRASA